MDLLDITSNRAPSVAYRIINPRDPFSQTEWAKQSAVRSIRPKLTADTEGNLDESLPKNTIEVHAKYANANGFFGLTSYLSYVQDQLKLSNDWITVSTKRYGAKHQFPWRRIDTANIEAVGFLDKPFEFTLDQGKILELLTGHTLYNDTGVVIRELVQNSIDAVRLSHGPNASTQGSITLKWHQQARTLEVWDNGTGMTQEIIERNFLRVGASYYQEESFKKENPDFSPISRFGIGVLSAFMVADQVEVVTCHPDDESARKLELRSVHGKYLIRLLNKEMDDVARALAPHGTMVKLHIRASAEMGDIGKLTQNWVLIPGCKVEVISDNGERLSIGYNSVKTALEAFLQKRGLDVRAEDEKNAKYRVIYKEEENVSVAYAVSWSNYFREWEFLRSMHTGSDLRDGSAICLEGIKVQDGVPGFSKESQSTYERSSDILALANIVGNSAPRTNVARSAFEPSRAYSQALTSIYGLYAQHVSEEVNRLQIQRQRSLTWAVSEAPILLSPISNRYFADDPEALTEALRSVPTLLIEKDGNRVQISACELRDHDYFWTVDGALPEHVEYILGELPAAVSMTQLLGVLGSDQELPDGPLLCTRLRGDMLGDLVLDEWVIAHLRGNVERRRCETKWVKTGQGVVWSNSGISIRTREWTSLIESITDYPSYNSPRELVSIPISGVTAEGFSVEDSAVSIGGRNYLLPGTEWIKVIKNDSTDDKPFSERMPADAALEALGFLLALGTRRRLDLERVAMPILTDSSISELVDLPAFVELWKSVGWSVFDTRRWQRKNEYYS